MASQPQPQTPVRVPKAATNYTPTTQDPDLRSQINTILLRDGHVEKIQSTLHHALHAHPANWPAQVAQHALTLLRTGDCTTFPALLERVLEDIRRDTARRDLAPAPAPAILPPGAVKAGKMLGGAAVAVAATANGGKGKGKEKEKEKAVGSAAGAVNGIGVGGGGSMLNGAGNGNGNGGTGLAVPRAVMEEGVRITRECLELVCEIEE